MKTASAKETPEERLKRLQDDYHQALKLGEVLVAYARVMMIGPGGVGKSSLLRGLMNKRLPQNAESTILADTKTLKPQFWAKAGESADSYWAEVTDQDEIQELAGLLQLVAQVKSGRSTGSHAAKILSTMAAAVAVPMFYPLGFAPQRVSSMQDENVSSVKDDVIQDVLQQALKHVQSNPENPAVPQSEVLMHVWDCGGQPVFLDVLPAFLTSRTMFLLFFDARRNLLDTCSSLSYKAGRVVSKSEQNFSLMQLLMQWMASIHAMCTRKDMLIGTIPEALALTSESEIPATKGMKINPFDPNEQQSSATRLREDVIPKFPRIIPVGTHGDDPVVHQKKTEILSSLQSQCENKAYTPPLLDGVIVNNTTAGQSKEAEDTGFKHIRERVHELASKRLAVRTPVAWVLFRKVLQKVAKGNPIVSYDQVFTVGQVCGIAEDVLPSVLHFYHELAVFLHYTQVPRLSHHIIADPQWLIKQLGRLLAPEGLEQKVSNKALWKPLWEYGILVQPLYEDVWEESNLNYNVQPQSLADLLEHFLLAAQINCPIPLASYQGRKYFVPSVLRLSLPDANNISKSRELVKISSLHLTFSTQYVPPGFFTRLATTLTRESKCQLQFKQGVFRNMITFAYGEIDEFTIFEHSSSVQITVVRTKYRQRHIPTFGSVCRDIMKVIQTCSAIIHQWLPSINIEETFLCEKCPDKNHFIPIPNNAITDSLLHCSIGHRCSPTREQQYWLKIPNTPEHLAQKGGLNTSELQGVADDVQKAGRLKDLVDELEIMPLFESSERNENLPFQLLKRWHQVEYGSEAHSLLVYHLRCIGLMQTSEKLYFREFLSDCYGERDIQMDIQKISRHMYGDLTLLAAALDISDEEVATIKSRCKNTRGQALQMLMKWQSSGTHSKQELVETLRGIGFIRAADMLASFEERRQEGHNILEELVFPDTPQLLAADRAQDTPDGGSKVMTATLQQQPSSSLPIPSTHVQPAFTSPRVETAAVANPDAITQVLLSTSSAVDTLDEHSLKDILNSISTVAANWFILGVALGLPYHTLERIESDYPRDAPRCLAKMIIAWLQNSSQPTWQGLVLALMSPLVNRVDIANTIATQHLHLCT